MKRALIIPIMFCVFISSVNAEETNNLTFQVEYKELQAKNKKLQNDITRQKNDIEKLKKQIIDQSKEIERLKALCLGNNINPTKISEKGKDKTHIIYKGRPRSPAWIEQQYRNFKNKIAYVDGNYIHTTGFVKKKTYKNHRQYCVYYWVKATVIGECGSTYIINPNKRKVLLCRVFQ